MNVHLLRREIIKQDDKIAEIHALTDSHLDEIKRHDMSIINMWKHLDDVNS